MDKRKRKKIGEDPPADVAKEAPGTKHERDQDANRSLEPAADTKKEGKDQKLEMLLLQKSTHRLTPSDDNYPKDCGDDKIYWKEWSEVDRVVREVSNQKYKDTCWAHATKKNIEARLKIQFNLDVSLSVDHLYHGIAKKMSTDAIKNFDELKNFLKNEGIIQEKDCECEKRTNKKDPCSKKIEAKKVGVLKIEEFITTKVVSEEELIQLVKVAPVMVSLLATDDFLAHKGEGIFYGDKRSKEKTQGNHLVLVIGYNSIDGQHYWIIQNTWGVKWGDKGFAKIGRKISRGRGQHSLFSEIVYPVISGVGGLA
ncbi:hypothetical protein F2Q69_00001105 [Brassica cretica]|uniref:Peptidase C1A papain C-terminal domain-containing protein n=1 Tax=Brassica cretica TaxID=69181 RepID=A0A8S9NTZ1_BRACR|nr:hypothetical protein F2Q69_00001105 [Brassica cretica]